MGGNKVPKWVKYVLIGCLAIFLWMGLYQFSAFATSPRIQYIDEFVRNSKDKVIVSSNVSAHVENKQHNGVQNKIFIILYWTTSYYAGKHWFGEGTTPFSECKYSNCYATSDRSVYNKSDAVLMLTQYLHTYPEYRFPHQKWILHNLEAPPAVCENGCGKYNNLFNATSSYDTRSDIVTNYSHYGRDVGGYFVKRTHINRTKRNYAAGKRRLVAWFANHVHTQSKRLAFALRLKQYIPVDIYGFSIPFHPKYECPRSRNHICKEKLKTDYKFYLSFENSLCTDYVTEKLWTAIYSDVVPIVLGAFNYSELLPAGSYINILDFESPKHLANYLLLLDRNDTLYNQYMAWKDTFIIKKLPPPQCGFCEYMNLSQNISKIYHRMDLFWNEKTQCQTPEEYYHHMGNAVWKPISESLIRYMQIVQ